MDIKLHYLKTDPKLKPYWPEIDRVSKRIAKRVKQVLPFKESVDVVFYRYHAPSFEHSVSGYAHSGNVVWIYMDPSQRGFKKNLVSQLEKTLSHELHHACRWQGPGYGNTLLEAIISEGLAAHFETEMTGKKSYGFYVKFSRKELERFYKLAKPEFNKANYNHSDWFFGNKKRKIPRYTAYGLGYWLVGEWMGEKKPSELVMKPSKQIFKI